MPTTIVQAPSTVAVPANWAGLHIGLDVENGNSIETPLDAIPAPPFTPQVVRNLKAQVDGVSEAGFWSNIETSAGNYDWSKIDQWVATTAPAKIVWMIYGTPSFYQLYPGEASKWPSWPGIASPPTEAGHTALEAFAQAVMTRYGTRIIAFEVWNEPTLPYTGGATSYDDRWDPTFGSTYYPANPAPFFSGSASDLANIAYTLANAGLGVPILGGGFVDQWDTDKHTVTRFLNAPVTLTGGSGTGKDHIDALSVHFYDYSKTPADIVPAMAGYRSKLSAAGVGSLDLWNTEMGAEGAGKTTGTDPAEADLVRKWMLLAAALGCKTAVMYAWASEPASTEHLAGIRTRSDVQAAFLYASGLAGKTITAAVIEDDGRVRVTTSDGAVFTAPYDPETAMASEIQAIGIDVEAIMDDALLEPIGSQKAYYVNQLITALGANPKIRFSRDGTPVYADVASTVLQHVSGNLKFPANWGGSPSPNLAADIDTGTWIAEIEKASDAGVKLLLTAGPVGSNSHMRIDRDLDGSSLITPGDMLFAAPASLDVGAPTVGDPNLQVETVIDDMGLPNDDAAYGFNNWWSRNPPAGITNAFNAWGTNWDAAVQAEWFANQGWVQSIIDAGTRYWRYFMPWFVPYTGDTHAGSNHAVKFWKFRLFARRKADLVWEMLRQDDTGATTGWSKATLGNAISTGDGIEVEYLTDAVKMRFLNIFDQNQVPNTQQFVHHGWWSSPQLMDESKYDLIIHAVLASLELWNPQGEDNRDQASIVLAMGGDPYPSSSWRPSKDTNLPSFAHSRLKKVRVQPTWHTCATLLNCFQDHRGPTAGASVSSLRLAPWPFVI